MNREEAYRAMLDGEKITHKEWDPPSFGVYLQGSFNRFYVDPKVNPFVWSLLSLNIEDGYEIYQEPKKKVVKRYWAWRINLAGWERIGFYLDDDGFDSDGTEHYVKSWEKTPKQKIEGDYVDVELGCE